MKKSINQYVIQQKTWQKWSRWSKLNIYGETIFIDQNFNWDLYLTLNWKIERNWYYTRTLCISSLKRSWYICRKFTIIKTDEFLNKSVKATTNRLCHSGLFDNRDNNDEILMDWASQELWHILQNAPRPAPATRTFIRKPHKFVNIANCRSIFWIQIARLQRSTLGTLYKWTATLILFIRKHTQIIHGPMQTLKHLCRLIYSFVGLARCKAWLKNQILNQRPSKLQKSILQITKTFTTFLQWILQPYVGNERDFKFGQRKMGYKTLSEFIANIIKTCLTKSQGKEGLIVWKTTHSVYTFFGDNAETTCIEQTPSSHRLWRCTMSYEKLS